MPQIANFDKTVAYFPFATDLSNLSALGGAYTAYGNVAVSADASSPYGYSASFDGTDDYIVLPNVELGTSDFELFARIKTTATRVASCIVSKDEGNFEAGAWTFIFNDTLGDGKLLFYMRGYSAAVPMLISAATAIADGNYHEVAVSRSGDDWRMFMDGVVVASRNWSGSVGTATTMNQVVCVGRQKNYTRDFAGNMCDVTVMVGAVMHSAAYTVDSSGMSYAISNSGTTAIKDSAGSAAARAVCALPRMAINRAYATTSSGSGTYSLQVPDIAVGYDVLILDNSISPLDDIVVRNVGRT